MGTGSMLQNPSHSYGSAGTYTVVLQVTDSAEATDTETKANYITVDQPLSVTTSPPTAVTDSSAILNGYLASRLSVQRAGVL